jgi:hypothetical protein
LREREFELKKDGRGGMNMGRVTHQAQTDDRRGSGPVGQSCLAYSFYWSSIILGLIIYKNQNDDKFIYFLNRIIKVFLKVYDVSNMDGDEWI